MAYIKSACERNGIQGFRKRGILPSNSHVISDEDYMPSERDRPLDTEANLPSNP